jgi:polygalacturonase
MTEYISDFRVIKTSDTITIFWKKPIVDIDMYELIMDENIIATTDKTYYTFKGLEPDTSYDIEIKCHIPNGKEAHANIKCATKPQNRIIDVTSEPYNAVGDGVTMNTLSIQKAIDDCKEGETVYIPKGVFATGALRLHSDMELYLDEGAVLLGTDNPEDYLPKIWSRFEGIEQECYSSLINIGQLNHDEGYNCKNVLIHGKGMIASGGRQLAENVINSERERLKDYLASLGDKINECEKPDKTIPGRARPRLVNISNSQNVVLSGITFKDGASWNVHMIYSDNVVTTDCTFYSENVWNGDGWDPDSSTNCAIFNCMFYTGDDSISIKSGKNPEGNLIERPTEHIWIFDCKCAFGHGITIGSEMSGGINDIEIWDCDMGRSMCGIEIKATKKRGGYVTNVHVRDSIAARILFHSVGYNDDGIAAPTPPIFENCTFERLQILGQYQDHASNIIDCEAIELAGFDTLGNELKNILFKDIQIGTPDTPHRQTISLQSCRNVTFERVMVY